MGIHSSQQEYNDEIREATERGWGKTNVWDLIRARLYVLLGFALPDGDGHVDTKTFDTMGLGDMNTGYEVETATKNIQRLGALRSILHPHDRSGGE